MNLPKILFWDSNMSTIDYELHARSIIERVITRGSLEDWKTIKDYYGLERIEHEILQMRSLDEVTLNFFSQFFNKPKEQFRCYTQDASIQQLWNY
jgi:hypothetical protein